MDWKWWVVIAIIITVIIVAVAYGKKSGELQQANQTPTVSIVNPYQLIPYN